MTKYTGFGTGAPSGLTFFADTGDVNLATAFYVTQAGCTLTKIRLYWPSGTDAPSTINCGLFASATGGGTGATGSVLAGTSGTLTALANSWCEYTLPTPYALTANTVYYATVWDPTANGGYGLHAHTFDSDITNTPLVLPASGSTVGGNVVLNGSFYYGPALAPTNGAFNASHYGVDVEISDGGGATQTGTGTMATTATLTGAGVATRPASGPLAGAVTLGAGAAMATRVGSGTLAAAIARTGAGMATRMATGVRTIVATLTGSASTGATALTGASAQISKWFAYSCSVERMTGRGVTGPVYGSAETLACMVDPGDKLVSSVTGETVLSTARVFLPYGTQPIPPQSQITLPSAFGGRRVMVINSKPYASAMGTPDHLEVSVS